jgi:NADPH-dependent glutamate synthase beta subunit-like oxidoreductase
MGQPLKSQTPLIPHQILEHLLEAEKLKYCFECGICTASCPMNELLPNAYNPRMLIEKIYHSPKEALKDPALWLCAWCYRCYRHCPQKVKLPEVLLEIRKIAKEQGKLEGFSQALELINQEIPFPASFGYICLHPERAELNIPAESSEHSVAGKRRRTKAASKAEEPDQKVAIIGAGPAGLTAAYELTKKGYPVTVYESSSHAGGMLRKCIPGFRLPKNIVDAEIQRIKKMGVEIKTGITVGIDLTFNDLHQEGFKAIFLSVGAHRTRKLGVEGEDLKGVYDALDFLKLVNEGEKVDIGERVAIVGGGNVAIDSARTAIRSSAKEVTILYRRSKVEMPANPYEIKEAEQEDVKINYLAAPKRILGQDGRVTALECVKMALGEPDETGRRAPKPIEGSEFNFPIDSVIVAIGEAPDLSFVPKEIEINENQTVAVEPFTVITSQPGIFAGGDCVSGPASVVEAVLAGKKAADCIDEYMRIEKPLKAERVLEGRKQV